MAFKDGKAARERRIEKHSLYIGDRRANATIAVFNYALQAEASRFISLHALAFK